MSRRTMLAVVAGVGLLAGCSGAATPAAQNQTQVALAPAAVVKAALTKTNAAGTANLHLTVNMAVAGKNVVMDMGGPVDLAGGGGDLIATISGAGDVSAIKMHEIMIGKVVYLKLNAPGVPDTWFKLDISKLTAALGSSFGGVNAGDQLKQLESMAGIKAVGTADVNGVATTHYKGQVDIAKVSGVLAKLTGNSALTKAISGTSIPLDVWIDGSDRVVKVVENFTLTIDGQTMTMNSVMNLTDFGVPLHLVAPPNAQDMGSMATSSSSPS